MALINGLPGRANLNRKVEKGMALVCGPDELTEKVERVEALVNGWLGVRCLEK